MTTKTISKTQKFIERAIEVHDSFYSYEKAEYINAKTKLIITCPKHGDFLQSPNSHLKGRGCKQCYLENEGYGKSKFVHFARQNICCLYLIEIFNDNERFLKIGITSKDVATRFSGSKKLPYDYKTLKVVKHPSSSYIWDKEVEIKRLFKKSKYDPNLKFKGYTECFNLFEKENILNCLERIESYG